MTEGRLETESRCRECLAIIKGEVTSNNLSKRRVRTRTHGVVGGRGLVTPSYPIISTGGGFAVRISYTAKHFDVNPTGTEEKMLLFFRRQLPQSGFQLFHAVGFFPRKLQIDASHMAVGRKIAVEGTF